MLVEINRLALAALGKASSLDDIDMVPNREHAARNPVSICGWLYKMKRNHRAFTPPWVYRWFTIEDGRLAWYSNKTTEKMNGFIDLSSVDGVQEFEEGAEGVYSFVVRSSERTLLLRAQNKRDMERWANNIRLQIQCIRDGNSSVAPVSAARRGSSSSRCLVPDQFDVVMNKLDAALQQIEKIEDEYSIGSEEPSSRKKIHGSNLSPAEAAAAAKWEVASSSSSSSDEEDDQQHQVKQSEMRGEKRGKYHEQQEDIISNRESALPRIPPPKPMRKLSSKTIEEAERKGGGGGGGGGGGAGDELKKVANERNRGEEDNLTIDIAGGKLQGSKAEKRGIPMPSSSFSSSPSRPLPPGASGNIIVPRPQPPKGAASIRRFESKEDNF